MVLLVKCLNMQTVLHKADLFEMLKILHITSQIFINFDTKFYVIRQLGKAEVDFFLQC